MLNAWNGVGLASDHSNEVDPCVSFSNSCVEVKKAGTAQGLLATICPFAKRSYMIYPNKAVATTDIRDPKLDTAFHAEKASG